MFSYCKTTNSGQQIGNFWANLFYKCRDTVMAIVTGLKKKLVIATKLKYEMSAQIELHLFLFFFVLN
jgi:hypothetical protein